MTLDLQKYFHYFTDWEVKESDKSKTPHESRGASGVNVLVKASIEF